MLATEKKITRVITKLDDNEIAALNDVYVMADCFIEILDANNAKEFINPVTGEIIDRNDLSRMLGVISGLNYCREWVLE